MDENKTYRIEYNQYEILSIIEDGEYTTASGNMLISARPSTIKTALTALGVNISKMDTYPY